MDATLKSQAEHLAGEIASQSKSVADLNSLMPLLMKSAMDRMLDTEMNVHLGRATQVAAAQEDDASGRSAVAGLVS